MRDRKHMSWVGNNSTTRLNVKYQTSDWAQLRKNVMTYMTVNGVPEDKASNIAHAVTHEFEVFLHKSNAD